MPIKLSNYKIKLTKNDYEIIKMEYLILNMDDCSDEEYLSLNVNILTEML